MQWSDCLNIENFNAAKSIVAISLIPVFYDSEHNVTVWLHLELYSLLRLRAEILEACLLCWLLLDPLSIY